MGDRVKVSHTGHSLSSSHGAGLRGEGRGALSARYPGPRAAGRRRGSSAALRVSRPCQRAAGFTLIELLTAVVLAAILLGLAVPSLQSFIQNRRITTAANDLLAAIHLARTEAMKRGATVVMCRTGDPSDLGDAGDEDPVCGANHYPSGAANASKQWGPGWLMYARPVGSEDATLYSTGTDALVGIGPAAPSGVRITSDDDAQTVLAFFGDGSLNHTAPVAFAVCDDRGASKGKLIAVPRGGRPQMADATTCTP